MIKEINKNLYETYLNTYKYQCFLHSSFEGDKLEHDGWIVKYIGYYKNEELCAAAKVSEIKLMKLFRYAYIHRGMIADYANGEELKEFVSELKSYLKNDNVVYLEIDPNIPYKQRDINGDLVEGGFDNSHIISNLKNCGFHHLPMTKGYNPSKQCRWISGIDLVGKSSEQVFTEFSYMTRQDVRNTSKFHVKTRELSVDELYILDDMEKETAKRQGFAATPLSYYTDLYKFFPGMIKTVYAYMDLVEYGNKIDSEIAKTKKSMDDTIAFLEKNPNSVKKQKRLKTDEEYFNSLNKKRVNISSLEQQYGKEVPLACCLFIDYGKEILYLVGASNYDCRNFKGPYAVQWSMIQYAIETGKDYYDFYGISGNFKEDEDGYGVFDYKRGFNAVVTEYIGNFILPVNDAVYAMYNKLKHVE